MADCIHHLDLCPDCAGLRVVRLERLEGVSNVRFDAGSFSFSGEAEVYVGPAPEPCPGPTPPVPRPTGN